MNRCIGILVFALPFLHIQAQEEPDTSRYFVYFKDKVTENYPYSISNPQAYLTQRAIDRRTRQNIPISESDLPVNPEYIAALRNEGIDVFFTSRWLNGALIQTHFNKEAAIESLNFVDSLRLVAKGERLVKQQLPLELPTEFVAPVSKAGDSDIQLMMLGADMMHADNIKGQNMLITVLDNGYTGVNKYTPFQPLWDNQQIIASKDFVENTGNVFQFGSHGTSVFSIIAAQYDTDTTDFYGIAHEADFILCVTEDDKAENTIEEYNWLFGAEFADSLGTDIINGSLGYRLFDIPEHNYTYENLDGKTAIVSLAAEMASDKGIIVVVSAGNEGNKSWKFITSPADTPGALTVGSVDPDFTRSSFSSIGPTSDGRIKPDVAAFGGATAVVRGNGSISRGSGTSFASPLIAGFAAGIWQANPEWTSQQVISAIKNSGHRAFSPDSFLGYGVPNYVYAVEGKALNVQDILEDKVTVYPNPFVGDTLYLLTEGRFKSGLNIKIMDPRGSLIYNQSYKASEIKEKMELSIDSSQQGVYFLFLQTGKDQKIVKLINF